VAHENLIRCVKFLATNHTHRKEIVANAKMHTLRHHTYFHRIHTMMGDLESCGAPVTEFLSRIAALCEK
jgi:spore maturation protein CgeB